MRYFQFLGIGLILGLFTEVQLKLVAGINPPAFIVALFAYPVIVTALPAPTETSPSMPTP